MYALDGYVRCFSNVQQVLHVHADNYLILLSYFTRQHGVDAEDVRKHLGVEEDYEDSLL